MTDDLPMYAPLDSLPGTLGKVTRADVVACARSWIGTPFIHQHRAKAHGVDCAGLVIGVARELGIVEPDFDVNGYARTPDGVSLIAECEKFMDPISMWSLRPGNVLVLKFDLDPQHIGIVGDYMHGGLTLIHAYGTTDGKGKVEERRLDPGRMRVMIPLRAFALRGVE